MKFSGRAETRMPKSEVEVAAGGQIYIANLTDGLLRATNTAHDAKTVRGKATARQLIELSGELMSRCYAGGERPTEILERAESQIFRIASREIRGGFQPTRELAAEAYKEIEGTQVEPGDRVIRLYS